MKKSESDKLLADLGRRFRGVLLIVAALLLVDQAVLQPLLVRLNGLGPVINLAGRQRMLSQRLAKSVLAMSADPLRAEEWRGELVESLAAWRAVHSGLLEGSDALNLPRTSDPEIRLALESLSPHVEAMTAAVQAALGDPEASRNAAQQMLHHEAPYLAEMDRIVSRFEQRAMQNIVVLRWLGWILTGLVLALMATLSRRVIRPASDLVRKQIRLLQSSESRYRQLVERMHDGLAVLSGELRIIYVNDRFAEMLQQGREQLLDRLVLDLVHAPDQPDLMALLNHPHDDAVGEINWNVPNGRCVTLAAPGRHAREDNDGPQFLIVTEITPQKIAEERLRTAHDALEVRIEQRTRELSLSNARLEQEILERNAVEAHSRELQTQLSRASRITSLGQFATGIAHEINQPLGAIATFSDALRQMLQRESATPADLQRTADRIRDAALRAGQIVSRMRSFLRARPVERHVVPANSLITEVLELCAGELQQHRIRVESRLVATEDAAIEVDVLQIQQVLVNILHNAIQAMADLQDGPRLLTLQTGQGEAGVTISVTDTGPGFPPEWLKCEPKHFLSTKENGLGMGLSISRSLVEAHQGELWFENVAPRGARVTFHLPVEERIVADHLCRR